MSAVSTAPVQLAAAFDTPSIDYGLLAPMLIVFGVAVVGVLVEAFMPRLWRHEVQFGLAGGGLIGAFVALVLSAGRRRDHRAGRHRRRRTGAVPAGRDPAARADRSAGNGRADTGHRRPVHLGRLVAARLRARAHADRHRCHPDRGLPAADVRGRRHADVPGGQRPADDVRRARGAVAAALPAVRARAPPAAALAGGVAEVLPARRVLLGVLPVRRGAALRLRRHGAAVGHRRRGQQERGVRRSAPGRHGPGLGRAAVQGRCGAVPRLDARRLPGRSDPDHRVHGRVHQGRRVRSVAAGVLRRARRARLGLAADDLGRRDPHHGGRLGRRADADRRQADARLLLDRARGVHPHRPGRDRHHQRGDG